MKRFISTTPRLSRVGAVARGLSLILGLSLVVAAPAFSQAEKQFADSMAKYLASPDGQKALGKTVEDYFQKRQEEMVKEREAKQKNDIEEQFKNPVKILAAEHNTSPARKAIPSCMYLLLNTYLHLKAFLNIIIESRISINTQ